MKLILSIHVYDISFHINCVFLFWSDKNSDYYDAIFFHRLYKMGKIEIDIFSVLRGIFGFLFFEFVNREVLYILYSFRPNH